MPTLYPIVQIPADASSQLERLGTKAKEWYRDAEGALVLFKEGRIGTGENWAEKVCCEICRLLNLPHAEYELARWGDREGVVSPTFVPSDGRLIHGNELLAKIHEDYEETLSYAAFEEAAKIRPAAGRYWPGSLESVQLYDFKGVLAGLPDSSISVPARLFALKMFEINRNRLLRLE